MINISTRIKSLSALLIALTALTASIGIWSMNGIGGRLEDIAEEDIPLTGMVSKIEIHQLEQEVALEKLLRAAAIKSGGSTKELIGGIKKLSSDIGKQLVEAEKLAEHMEASANSAEARAEGAKVLASLKKIEAEATQYHKELEQLVTSIEAGNLAGAEAHAGTAEKEADELGYHLDELLKEIEKFTESAAMEAEHAEYTAIKTLIGVFAGGLLIGIVGSTLIGRSICRPLDEMCRIISGVAQNKDLTLRVPDGNNDEIGQTARSFNGLMDSFQEAIHSVNLR